MKYFLSNFLLGKIIGLIAIANFFCPLYAAEIFVKNLIEEYKQLDSPLALTIGSQGVNGKEIIELLPLPVRKKVYKLELTYGSFGSNKIPSNLDELFPNLAAITTTYSLPENLKILFENYKIFRWYDAHTRTWVESFDKVPVHAFYQGEYRIENNVKHIPGEENYLETNFSMDEVQLLAGNKPMRDGDEQDYAFHFEQGELIIDGPVPISEPETIHLELSPLPLVYHPPLGNPLGTMPSFDSKELIPLYLPRPTPNAEPKKESRFSLHNKQRVARRQRTYSQNSLYKKKIEELIEKNPIYTDAIRKFFGQIDYIKKAPKTVSPAIIPLPGPPGTGKTYVIKQLTANAGIPIRELKFHMQKGAITLPLREALEQIADPVDNDSGKTNVLFFDEIQNVMGEEEIIANIKSLKPLRDFLEEKKREYKDNAKSIGDNKNNSNIYNEEIKKAEVNYERELEIIKNIIAQKEDTYFLLQETFGTGYFTKKTKQAVAGYMQLFTDYAGSILKLGIRKKEFIVSLEQLEKIKRDIEETLKKHRLTVALSEEDKKVQSAETELLQKQLKEIESESGSNKKELLEIESSLKTIKGPLAVLMKELQGDYPRLLGHYNELKEPNLLVNQFMKTPAKFLSLMQTQSENTQAQSNWCLNRTIVFLAVNNHPLITRVNARFNSAQNKKQRINPEEYRRVYEEEIDNQELQDMVLKKFTYYDAKAALNEFLGLGTEEIEQETSISSRLNIENFREKLPPGKQEWHEIILMQLQNLADNISEELNHGGVGRVAGLGESEHCLEAEELADNIIFQIEFGEKLIDFIYQKTTGTLGFRTFIPKFNELLQGFDNELKMALFELQESYEKEFVLAASNYFDTQSETIKLSHKNSAYDAQRKIYSLKNLSIELGDNIANPVIIVIGHWEDEKNPIHTKVLEFTITFAEEELTTKDPPAHDSLPFANEVAAMLVLGMSNFLSLPQANIDLSASSVDADFISKLWPDRTVSNFSYIYRKIMTSLGAIAVANRLNNNVIKKANSGYHSYLKRIINDLRQTFLENEREKNLCQKNKLPLREVIGDNLSQIVLFQKIYYSNDDNEIMQYLFDNAIHFVDFYQNIINAIAQEVVRKKAAGNTLSFTSTEMRHLVDLYWPGTDFSEQHGQLNFWDRLWGKQVPTINFASRDIVNGKIKNALLSNPEGDSNVLLCENENIKPEKVKKPQSLSYGLGSLGKLLGCFQGNPFELIRFSEEERHEHGFVPPQYSAIEFNPR